MNCYMITMCYDGTAYAGYQRQKNANTVGEELLKALNTLFGSVERLAGCSRTDSGVHAYGYCASFSSQRDIPDEKVVVSLNGLLPRDISVLSCKRVSRDFHARYSVKSKEYIYRIWNGKQRNPFYEKYALFCPQPLDELMLTEECKAFIGEHDFSSFCASGASAESHVRRIDEAYFERKGDLVEFHIRGNGFLYNMVRIIVGTCLDTAAGKLKSGGMKEIINAQNRNAAGKTAPAHGLFLYRVYY